MIVRITIKFINSDQIKLLGQLIIYYNIKAVEFISKMKKRIEINLQWSNFSCSLNSETKLELKNHMTK